MRRISAIGIACMSMMFMLIVVPNALAGGQGGGKKGCPQSSKNPGGQPPCGVDHHGTQGKKNCPHANHPPPCGKKKPPPPPPPPPKKGICGPADLGGTGPMNGSHAISGALYTLGGQLSSNGGAALGDPVQSIACAVNEINSLGL
jgi:hypothetical protein